MAAKDPQASTRPARQYPDAVPQVIAFAVLAHEDPEMVRRLAAELHGHFVVVHVDAKSDIGPFEQIPGIHLVQDRVAVHWGGFSVVEATLRLYRDCLDELGDEPNAAIALLSGSDFPVRPVEEFEEYVAAAPWSEHIRAVPLIAGDRPLENRIRRRWFFDLVPPRASGWRGRRNAVIRRVLAWVLPRRSLAAYEALTPTVSSQWTLLSRACLEDVLRAAHDPAYQRLFRHTFAPDELFFATLVHSSPWSAHTEFGGLESRGDKETTEFPNFHYIDPSVAVWLDPSHARKVAESGAYFARKLRSHGLDDFLAAVTQERSALPGGTAPRGAPASDRSRSEDS